MRKGFTLIELLAVIIIISIIALIATPIILNVIETSRRGAFKDSSYSIFEAADYYFFENGAQDLGDVGLSVTSLKLKNGGFISGFIKQVDGIYKLENVTDGIYCASGTKNDLVVYKGDCDVIIPSCSLDVTSGYIGANYWYGEFPTVTMTTSEAQASGLKYGIGLEENYTKDLNEGKIGTLNYKFTNDVGVVNCYVKSNTDYSGTNSISVKIDKTGPTLSNFTYSTTSNSIIVVANGEDLESGISRYQFSKDDGATWLPSIPQINSNYVFSSLNSGSYNVKVKVYNGTYNQNIELNKNKISDSKSVTTTALDVPTYLVSASGWAQSKTTIINYSGDGAYLLRPSVNVKTNVSATTCSAVSNGTYTCNDNIIAANGTLTADTWYKVTSDPTLTFTSNGYVIAQVSDGVNYIGGSTQTIEQLDTTAPTVSDFTYSSTSNSITVIASGEDAESGISRYQFSKDDGVTWLPSTPQVSNSYTFNSLTSGTYKVMTKVYNGTYALSGGTLNYKISTSKSVSIAALVTPTYTVNSTGWNQSKTVLVNYSGAGAYLLKPSVSVKTSVAATTCSAVSNGTYTCSGAAIAANGTLNAGTWYKVMTNPTLTFTSVGNVIAQVSDSTNYVSGSSQTVEQIDTTAPTVSDFTYTTTSNSISVTASGTDVESGISRYQFSKDDGVTWLPSTPQTINSYTFSSLVSGTYKVKTKVYNGTYALNGESANFKISDNKSVVTVALITPTYTVNTTDWSQSKTVLVNFSGTGAYLLKPSVNVKTSVVATTCSAVSNGTYTCSGTAIAANGTLNAGTWYKVTTNPTLTFTSVGNVIAQVSDGVNYIGGSTQTVEKIDITGPTITNVTVSGKVATFTLTDNVLAGYGCNQSTTVEPTWTAITGATISKTCTVTSAGTYYIWAKDSLGNTSYASFIVASSAFAVPFHFGAENNQNRVASFYNTLNVTNYTRLYLSNAEAGTYVAADGWITVKGTTASGAVTVLYSRSNIDNGQDFTINQTHDITNYVTLTFEGRITCEYYWGSIGINGNIY